MTLLLAAVKKQFVVLSADGAEFRHNPGQKKFIEADIRQKLFPLTGRSVVFAIHGQNRLTLKGEDLSSQRLIGDILVNFNDELSQIPIVEDITQKLLYILTPDVTHTFTLLQSYGIHQSALGICVIGFDSDGGRSRGFEAFWPMLTDQKAPHIIKHVLDNDKVRIMHSGSGAKYAEMTIRNPHLPYSPNNLIRASIPKTQKYIRGVYRNANTLQSKSDPTFGGKYQEITIKPDNIRWTISIT